MWEPEVDERLDDGDMGTSRHRSCSQTSSRRSGQEENIPTTSVGEPGLYGADEDPALTPKGVSVISV